MKKNKIFVACDSTNILKIKKIISKTRNSKINVGYKFGLEFLNSKNGSNWLVMGRPITKGNIKKNIQNLIDHLRQ